MRGVNSQKVLRAYQVYKSIRTVARILQVSYGSVHKILEDQGALLPWDGFNRVNRWKGGNRGPVTRWIEHHPSVVLPVSCRELAKLTGCSEKETHSWKVARWSRMKRLSSKLIPKKIIKKMDYRHLLIHLVDGSSLGAEELFKMSEKIKVGGKKK